MTLVPHTDLPSPSIYSWSSKVLPKGQTTQLLKLEYTLTVTRTDHPLLPYLARVEMPAKKSPEPIVLYAAMHRFLADARRVCMNVVEDRRMDELLRKYGIEPYHKPHAPSIT